MDPIDAVAWYNKANALLNLGKHDEAFKCFEEAIKMDPNYAAAWNDKGVALVELGKYGEAFKCYEKAINHNDNSKLCKGVA